ncbi:MAG: putative quorum-quenching lactonase YtnP [Bacteroidetes bacterium ADurb.Bin408]|nr:MAG: putative quorum-quenching lactonase YtnP [Bacteroidetes bacterium ADurb.Bin408]
MAYNPNKREKASFFNENTDVLREKGLVRFVNNEEYFTPHIYLKIVNGHTLGQLIPIINYGNRILVYTADFIPSLANIAIPYIASYDTQPLVSMEEKEIFLEEAVKNNYILFFEHDYYNECCTVKKDEKGRFKEDAVFKLSDLTVNS